MLSHVHHFDNLDNKGRKFLPQAKKVITTEAGLKSIPHHLSGMAIGIYTTMQRVSSTLGVTIIGGLFNYVYQLTSKGRAFNHAKKYGLYADVAYLLISFVRLQFVQRKK